MAARGAAVARATSSVAEWCGKGACRREPVSLCTAASQQAVVIQARAVRQECGSDVCRMVIVLEPSTGRGGAGGMTVDDMTISGKPESSPHHPQTTRSRFMITDILSSGPRSPCSSPASSSDGPRDLSLHCRGEDSDGHESGTDSGLPGETSSVCSNGESLGPHYSLGLSTFLNKPPGTLQPGLPCTWQLLGNVPTASDPSETNEARS
jgi:hypothetical protein